MPGVDIKKYKFLKDNNIPSKGSPLKHPDKKERGKAGLFDFLNKDFKFFDSQLSDKKKEALYLKLSTLISAGVDIKSTLELVENDQRKEKDKQLFKNIKETVIEGSSLSEAINKTTKFSKYEYYSLQIGEETGKLPVVFKELAEFYQKKIRQKRQFINALSYPAIVLLASLGAIVFMLKFIVPMFADVFIRFGKQGELPFITKMILNMSNALGDYFYYILFFIIGLTFLIINQRKKEWFRKMSSSFVLKLPVFGELIRKIYLARFCHSMTLLIGSKIPIIRALNLTKQMIGFYPIEKSLNTIEEDILQGQPLNRSLESFAIYDKSMIALIKVGEEVNKLELFFDKIANQYSEEVEHQTSLLGTLLEPFLIIFLGLVVGLILIAMYLPIFQLSTSF